MKKLFRLMLLFLSVALLICAVGCTDKRDDNLDEFESLLLSTSTPAEYGDAFASAIYVVIPSYSGFELVGHAKSLADAISEKTGINTFLKSDSEPTVEGSFELLVGYTSRLISEENLSPLREDDYICRYDRGAIVLGGRSERATIEAINRFKSEILPGASYASLMSEYAYFEGYGEYAIDELTLNGFSIHEYTLVYSRDAYEIADVLLRYIGENSGYWLTTSTAESYEASGTRHIYLLLDENKGSGARISSEGGNVLLSAPDLCGLSLAVSTFISELLEDIPNNAGDCTVEGSRVLDYNVSGLDLAFGFVDNTGNLDIALTSTLGATIRKTESALICFSPTKSSLAKHVRLNAQSGHTYLEVDLGDGIVLPILYKSAEISLIETECRDGSVWINATVNDGKLWRVRIKDVSGESLVYESDEILLLSGSRLGDGHIDRIAEVTYGSSSDKVERLIYSENATCLSGESVGEYSSKNSYCGIFAMELLERYHESYIILKDALK